jgi:hypothetical protein
VSVFKSCSAFALAASLLHPLTGCSPPELRFGTARSEVTATFQDEFNGYDNTDDGLIRSDAFNGANDFGGPSTLIMINTASNYEAEYLVRFNGITLPQGATVTSAKIQLTFEDFYGGHNLSAYYLKNSWTTAAKWIPRDTTNNWAVAGAKGVGTDITSSTAAFNDPPANWTAAGPGLTREYPLSASVVQGWIDSPSTNQGLVLRNSVIDKQLRVYTAEHATDAYHPKLTIEYTTGGGGTDAGGGGTCFSVASGTWRDDGFSAQTNFTANFDATPSAVNVDELMAFTNGSPGGNFNNLAAIARFFTNGRIEARDFDVYRADNVITYAAGTSYHFRFVIDAIARTYSVFVTPSGGSEVTLATNYRFRDTAPSGTSLNNFATQSGIGTLQICDFSVTPNGGGGGTGQHPRIFLDQTTLMALVAKASTGTDPRWNALKAKCNNYLNGTVWAPPDGISDPKRPYCGGCTDSNDPVCVAAAANDSACGSGPNICCGYQGSMFYDAVLNLGLCYQIGTLKGGETNLAAWGAKGVAVLNAMASFKNESGDGGYGIRNFGTGMAIGFDWLYTALTSNDITNVVNQLNDWTTWYDASGNSRAVPPSNYFAGYFAAKAYIGIATEDDNTSAATTWSDFLNRLYRGAPGALGTDPNFIFNYQHAGVADYFKKYLDGNGYPQSWQYGNLSVRNMTEPLIAAKTGKQIDLFHDATQPFTYAFTTPLHLIHMTWPSLAYIDDRDDVHNGSCPGNSVTSKDMVTSLSSLLLRENDANKNAFHSWARAIRGAAGTAPAEWLDFLFWDDSTSLDTPSYTTLPRSYFAQGATTVQGKSYASMRSAWSADATWASLRAMAQTNSNSNAHQFMDAGALAITRGNVPFLVNPGFLVRCYTGTSASYSGYLGAETIGTDKPRQFFNVFYTSTTHGQQSYEVMVDKTAAMPAPAPPMTGIRKFDDKNGYVITQAEDLEDVYADGSCSQCAGGYNAGITSWSRSLIYLRPNIFVVYDRTTTSATGENARMAWHFPPLPVQQTTGVPVGSVRWNVNDTVVAPPEGGFKGAMTTVLPQNARVALTNVNSSNKLYRLGVRAPSGAPAPAQWLTVFDASSTTGAVVAASVPTGLSSNVKATLLTTSTQNYVVLFGSGAVNAQISGNVLWTEPSNVSTKVVLTDLAANTNYNVDVVANGANYNVTVRPYTSGTAFTTSGTGTLYVVIATNGSVSAGT